MGDRAARDLHALDVDVAPIAFRGLVAAQLSAGFAHEAALLALKRIQVKMEAQFAYGIERFVAPGESFLPGDRFRGGIEFRPDAV